MKNTLRIGTWNIHLGLRLSTITQQIQEHDAFADLDILALQEVSTHKNEEDAKVIANTLGSDYDYFQFSTHTYWKWKQGNALIWNKKRFKIITIDTLHLPQSSQSLLPKWESRLLRFIPKQQRNSIVVEGIYKKKRVRVYVTHLDVVGYTHRWEQLRAVLLAEEAKKPVDIAIIAGDMNTIKIPTRDVWKNFAAQVESYQFKDITTAVEWTHFVSRRLKMKQKLDAIFLKPATLPYTSWSLDVRGSDHLPVFANIALV